MMEEPLISKKDLLELTGISYGQLYRWKRKNIIPDEWFIRKSTFTGQETFFPRRQILERIDKIVSMKDSLSLDELAEMFSLHMTHAALPKVELMQKGIATSSTLSLFTKHMGDAEAFTFEHVVCMYVLEHVLKNRWIEAGDAGQLLQFMARSYAHFQGKTCELLVMTKQQVHVYMLVSSPTDFYTDEETQITARLSLSDIIEQLKSKLQ